MVWNLTEGKRQKNRYMGSRSERWTYIEQFTNKRPRANHESTVLTCHLAQIYRVITDSLTVQLVMVALMLKTETR